ncbi:MAG: glycerol kinase GlpK [Coxiellaceae bacterium]|nr:glycerol kinase GlpK [Coxiellaceae bacterium]
MKYLLAIDQGTTSTRAIVFDTNGRLKAQHQIELPQSFPQDGWVEHNPEEIWQATLACCQQAIKKAHSSPQDILGIGISNQRETTILWDRATGKPIYPAIVWQDRRTADLCEDLAKKNIEKTISKKTGLLLDPYFSATKIHWILNHVPGAREDAEKGKLAFGTIDTFLLWRLTKGKVHATDASNASRTMLFNIHKQSWDKELLKIFDIPESILPKVYDNAYEFGKTDAEFFQQEIPITGMAGDQQAASFGQAIFEKGMVKSTYGTGCFVLMNTGDKPVLSKNRLISTVAYRLNNKVTYGLEGSIFVAGAAVQWLRDAVHLIGNPNETQAMALSVEDTGGVYMVPAFTGLGAPYWDPKARAALLGLTRDSCVEHIVRAALEAVCYQTKDLMTAMQKDASNEITTLRVDGGMVSNDWLLQFLADILAINVHRPQCIETSALGAAFLAGLGAGVYASLNDIAQLWQEEKAFVPEMQAADRDALYEGWQDAVKRILS